MTLGRKRCLVGLRGMRWIMVLGVGFGLAVPGCARLNPAFGIGEEDATGGAESVGSSTRGAADTEGGDNSAGVSSFASDSSAGSDLGPGPHVCGDDIVDPGEECDDGNLEWGDGCDEICQAEPLLDWLEEGAFVDGIPERFNDIALVGDVVVAAGRGADLPGGDHVIRLVSFDADNGEVLGERAVEVGAGVGGEARGMAARGSEIYYGGRTNEPGVDAVFGVTELNDDGTFGPAIDLPVMGARAKGIAFRGPEVLVTTGFYNQEGLGISTCPQVGDCTGWVRNEAGSQLDDLVVTGRDIFAAGLRDGSPHLYRVVDPATQEGLLELFAEPLPGRFQALAIRGDTLYAAGSVTEDGDEDAWVLAYSLSRSEVEWEDRIDDGSVLDDEFEDIAVADDGSIIVVGMLGSPPVPVVFEYGPQGALRWELSIELEPGVGSGHARGVAVDGEEIYIAGEWRQTYTPGDGTAGTGVGFVARILR